MASVEVADGSRIDDQVNGAAGCSATYGVGHAPHLIDRDRFVDRVASDRA